MLIIHIESGISTMQEKKEKEHKTPGYFKRFLLPATGEVRIFPHQLKYKSSLYNVKNVLKNYELGHFSGLFIIVEEKQLPIIPHDQCHAHPCTVQSETHPKSYVASGCSVSGKRNLLPAPSQSVQEKNSHRKSSKKELAFYLAKVNYVTSL